ncbi:MAG: MFS transporter, partial [Myxococcota bacterium]
MEAPANPTSAATVVERAVLLLASSLTVMASAIISPALPKIAATFSDVPNIELLSRLILTGPALMIAVSASAVGALVDRYGRRPMLIGGMALYAIAGTSGLYLSDIYSLLAGRLILGIAVAACMTTAVTVVGDRFRGEARTKFMGVQAAFMSAGGVLYVIGGGLLADFHWRGPFAVYGVAALLAIVAFLGLRESKSAGTEEHAAGGKSPVALIATLGALALLSMIITYLIPTQLPFFLQGELNVTATQVGLAIAAMTAASATGSLLYPRIVATVGRRGTLALAFATPALGLAGLAFAQSYPVVVLATAVLGSGMGFVVPGTVTWVTEVAPAAYRGRVMGLLTMCFFLGQFLSPLVAAPLSGNGLSGVDGLFSRMAWLAAALTIALLGWAGWSARRSP